MAQYIIQKMADVMHGNREKLYPKLVNGQTVDSNRLAEIISKRSSFDKGEVLGLLNELADTAREILADGKTLSIDGLGYLKPVLGLVDKEERGEWIDAADRTTTRRNVALKTISFKPTSRFLLRVGRDMKLNCIDSNAVTGKVIAVPSLKDRIAMALDHIDKKGFMRVFDYVQMTHLPRSTASKELRELAEDENSPIASNGVGATKVYIRRLQNP